MPLNDAREHDLEAMASEVTAATRMVIVCNPNNPTRHGAAAGAIDDFVAPLPRNVAVILDEAYVEFSTLQDPDESLDLLEAPPQPDRCCAPSRRSTGSAACAWATRSAPRSSGSPWTACASRSPSTRSPQAAATEALNHLDEVERRVEQTAIERVHVESELEERGLETTDSQANFSWVSLGDRDEDAVVDGLAQRGVIVRAGGALGQEGWMRVTYGTRRENDRFLAAAGRSWR